MHKNSPATANICKLLMEQSRLIKQFEYDMQRVIQNMMFEMGASPVEESVHEALIKEGIEKALAKNCINVQNLCVPIVVNMVPQNGKVSLITRS